MRLRFLCFLSLLTTGFVLGGCSSFTIVKPSQGQSVTTQPVSVDITWNDSNMASIQLTVDGVDQTGSFTFTDLKNTAGTVIGREAKHDFNFQLGQHTVGASGTYYFLYTQNASATTTFTVSAPPPPPPTISSLSKDYGPSGTSVTIAGTNFSTTCSNNTIKFGGVPVPAANVSTNCSSTAISFTVPTSASFGSNNVTVSANNTASNTSAFRVVSAAGNFTEITADIENRTASTLCTTGSVKLNICSGTNCSQPTYPLTASFTTSGGAAIGQPLGFHANGTGTTGIGGAGFSLCTVGVVLDADTHSNGTSAQAMGIQFLDLVSKRLFPNSGEYFFNYGAGNVSYVPRIFRSPDGTILIVATVSTTGPSKLTAAVIDQGNPNAPANTNCTSTNATNAFLASVTASNTGNKVNISLAGTTCSAIALH